MGHTVVLREAKVTSTDSLPTREFLSTCHLMVSSAPNAASEGLASWYRSSHSEHAASPFYLTHIPFSLLAASFCCSSLR